MPDRPKNQKEKLSPALTDAQRSFHLAEFSKINSEVTGIITSSTDTFKYAALSSGGLFAWLLTGGANGGSPFAVSKFLYIALWTPLALTAALAIYALAAATRLKEYGEYLGELERNLGASRLGWERRLSAQNPVIHLAAFCAWGILFLGDVSVPLAVAFW